MKRKNYSELEKTRNRRQMRAYVREVAEFYANTDNGISKPYITNYYQITDSCYYKILEYAVIWGVVDDVIVKRMEEKTSYNAQLHSGTSYRTENKYSELKKLRREYAEFPFSRKEAKEITHLFIEERINKENLARKFCTTKSKIDKAIYVSIESNWVKDEIYNKIKESSLKVDSSEETVNFFKKLDSLRELNKKSS
jgi:hypothetical protein